MNTSPRPLKNEAIILMGHGSRVPRAANSMVRVAQELEQKFPHAHIAVCYMSRLGPHFPETFKHCVEQGAKRVVVIPYFLHLGMHMLLDIPTLLQQCASEYPEVEVVLGECLGFDPCLVDLVERRIQAAQALPDVRKLSLPPADAFPVPEGQDEFVPMPPHIAAKWREGQQVEHAHHPGPRDHHDH